MSVAKRTLLCLMALAMCQGLSVAAGKTPVPSGTWSPAGEMKLARAGASVVLLRDGRVLVAGGASATGPSANVEVYDPVAGSFGAAASMRSARSGHSSVLLADGRVLVTGGSSRTGVLASAEIYQPSSDTWSEAAGMTEPRSGHTATMLADGRVLVAGGEGAKGARATLELFDPARNVFAAAGALSSARLGHAAVLLSDGKVLIIGGSDGSASLSSTDIFDASNGQVAPGPALLTPRAGSTATPLLNGKVLVAGGSDGKIDIASAEIYDPAERAFSSTAGGLIAARSGHLAFRLPFNNQVLIVGGMSGGIPAAAAELYVPWNDASVPTDPLWTARAGAGGTPLRRAGRLLVVGGTGIVNAEVYAFPTLVTDRSVYAPGAVITIAGAGWQPGETVALLLQEQPALHDDRTIAAVADEAGTFRTTLAAEPHEAAVRLFVTASGSASQAQATFTTAAGSARPAEAEVAPDAPPPAAAKTKADRPPKAGKRDKKAEKRAKADKRAAEKKAKADKRAEEKRAKAEKRAEQDKQAREAKAAKAAQREAEAAAKREGTTVTATGPPQAAKPARVRRSPDTLTPSAAPPPGPGEQLQPGSREDDTVADFNQGAAGLCRIVAHTGDADGEVIQQPTVIEDFNGSLGSGWQVVPWAPGGGAAFDAGQIHVNGARVNTTALYPGPRTLEFRATFRAAPFQHIGFGQTLGNDPSPPLPPEAWAIFSTMGGTGLWARTRPSVGLEQTTLVSPLPIPDPVGNGIYFRIEWTTTAVNYYIDDLLLPERLVATHLLAAPLPDMRPILSDFSPAPPALSADWVRMSPFSPDCTFTSRVFDAGATALWTNFVADQNTPPGTSITICVRVGSTNPLTGPFGSCSPAGFGPIVPGVGRFAQYTAFLSSTDIARRRTPELLSVVLNYLPTCEGVVCPDTGNVCMLDVCDPNTNECGIPAPTQDECRRAEGDCDVAEFCDGMGACPADGQAPAGTACGGADDTACSNPDTCDGAGDCQENNEPTTTLCRPDAGACDVAEFCDGGGRCPDEGFEPAGTACGDPGDTACDDPDTCDGGGTCEPNLASAATVCRPSVDGGCDLPESCTGTDAACPVDAVQPSGTLCRQEMGACAADDFCDGASAVCPQNFDPSTQVCRPAVGPCDRAESCSGSSNDCPADGFLPATTTCRAAAGECDAAESCTGGSGTCPVDAFRPSGAACGDPADTQCTDPDRCNGTGACLRNDSPAGTSCGSTGDTPCSNPDSCTGTGTCSPNHEPAGTACGSPVDTECTNPDTCNAGGACQSNDAADGSACSDGKFCTATDRCTSGACGGTGSPCRDSNACTPDKCDESRDRCAFDEICDDDDDGHDDDHDGDKDEEDYDHNGDDDEDGDDNDSCDDDEDDRSRSCVLKTTGGGKTYQGSEFGFNAKGVIGSWANGQFEYRGGNVRIKARVSRILDAYDTPNGGVMKFEVITSNGTKYHVTAEDHGEPGKDRDALTIYKVSGPGPAPNTTARQVVRHGNVQWHGRLDADDDHHHGH